MARGVNKTMSASKDKKLRKQQIAEGTDKRTAAQKAEKAKQRKSAITYTLVAIVLVVFFAFIFIYNSSWPSRHMTAVTVDGTDYSVAQANFYYSNSYMNFYNNYATYINYGMFFDPQQSLADQEYGDGTTWRDFFRDSAVQDIAQIQMLCDEAEAAGFTLSEEQQALFDQQYESLTNNWSSLNYESLQQYINLNYGKGVDEDMLHEELYRTFLASAYADSVREGFEYTTAELDDHYAEEADQMDEITYAVYTVSAPVDETETAEEPAEDAADAEAAEDTAEPEVTPEPEPAEPALDQTAIDAFLEAVDGTDEETFTDYIAENFDGATVAPVTLAGSSLSTNYSEFLLDASRKAGDADAITADDGTVYLVMFLDRDTNDYKLPGFRHILVNAQDTDGDGVYSEEEIQAAADAAQAILDEWKAGDATEDSFAALANERSEDSGSNTSGGLYENVPKGQMVPPIDEWIYDSARKAGDTTVVTYDGQNEGSYTGAHVVYFTGLSDLTYARTIADSEMRTEAFNAFIEEHMTGYEPVTAHMGMVGKHH